MPNWIRTALICLLLAAILWAGSQAARADLDAFQEDSQATAIALFQGQVLEQTFIPSHEGMKAVLFYSKISDSADLRGYSLTLALVEGSSGAGAVLARQTISLEQARAQPRIEFQFPVQPGSKERIYRVSLQANAPQGLIQLIASQNDAYSQGELRINQKGQPQDLAFRVLDSAAPWDWLGDLAQAWPAFEQGLGLFLAAGLMGAALLILLAKPIWGRPLEWAILAISSGLALVPLLYQTGALFHIALTPQFLRWLPAGLAVFACARLALDKQLRPAPAALRAAFSWKNLRFSLLAGLLFLAAVLVRLAQVRDLGVPSWTDGLVHLDLIERIAANQGIPSGLLYHSGYHTLVLFATALTGAPIPETLLVVGQWFSALVGLAFLALALRLLQNRSAALLGACLIWFLAPFPSYLFNWGRYPFLLGLALLCAALCALLAALEERRACSWLVALFLSAGMVLCHYGTAGLWLTFVLAFGLQAVLAHPDRVAYGLRQVRLSRRAGLIALALAAAGGLALLRFGPALFSGQLSSIVSQSRQAAQSQDYAELLGIATRGGGLIVGLMALYGAGIGLRANRRLVVLSLGWILFQVGLIWVSSPWIGEAIASYTNLIIASALPLALLSSLTVQVLLEPGEMPARSHPAAWQTAIRRALPAVLTGTIVLAGGSLLAGQVNPATVLLTPADARAMQWIRENTPGGAVFLVRSGQLGNAEPAPADGGSWLTAETGRKSQWMEGPALAAGSAGTWQYVYLGKGILPAAPLNWKESGLKLVPVYDRDGIRILKREN